jgi:hypothetical protein
MKKKNLPTILLIVVAFGLIASMFFQLYLLNEIDYLWGELDETYQLLLGVLEKLKEVRYGIQI